MAIFAATYPYFMIYKLNIVLGLLLVSLVTACGPEISSQQSPLTPPTTSQQTTLIRLEDLNQDTPSNLWEQFFQERGALRVWKELQQNKACVIIDFRKLDAPLIPIENQVDQVGAAIIEYLSYHNLSVKELRLCGMNQNTDKGLTNLSPSIGNLVNLTALDLNYNQLTQLPSNVNKLTKLTEFSINGNPLTELPQPISNLVNLEKLYLSSNRLSTLPSFIGNLVNLKYLYLYGNRLTTLPTDIGNLVNLTKLHLGSNQLITLPATRSKLTNLTSLHLGDNQLTTLPQIIDDLVNLTELQLNNNRLTELPTTIGKLVKLNELDLKDNHLTQLPPTIGNLVNLSKLNLSNNQLTILPPNISNLVNLRYLHLDKNQLTKIPDDIDKLVNLNCLWLEINQLTQLPQSIGNLINLKKFNLKYNKLTALPAKLAKYFLKFASDSFGNTIRLDLTNSTWLQAQELTGPIDQATLSAYSYEVVPRSLVTICAKHVQNRYNQATDTSRQAIIKRLPEELHPNNLSKLIERESTSIYHQRIIYFEHINNQDIPFYWDQELCTPQDVNNMLEALKDKKVFLAPEHSIPN